jgi:hypothetical protein
MYNGEEKFAVTAGLACLCGLGAVSAVVPGLGYVLLGLVVLSVMGLVVGGMVMWWATRYQLDNLPRRASVEARARQSQLTRQEVA